ncbi:MAG: aromatic ring-hydroxylating dioxygenase subunit alpha [Ignavibacteriota bacterium]
MIRHPLINEADLEIQPLEIAETIPSSWYTSEDMHELEIEAIFSKSWQFVGRADQVRTPGDQFIAEIAGESVIIVRGKDDVLRGFYNVCRHRGGPLVTENGCSSVLQCRYHGWTYALDGSLRGVPDWDRVELFEKSDFDLVSIRVQEWQGLIFANLGNRTMPLANYMKGIAERIAPIDLSKYRFHSQLKYEVNCNWKVYVDNYLEGYHVPIVHPELMKLYDFSKYETETFDWYSLQHSPLSGEENIYSSGQGEALYFQLFPNLMLNILPGRLQTNLVMPLTPGKCIVYFDYFFVEGTSDSKIDADLEFSDAVQGEDIEICELVQRGLSSRSYNKGRFSVKRENAVHHFQSNLKRMVAEYLLEVKGSE